ncbi:undecaprenyl/decaprenyl-phosphate alpha-N-acetylglucosaminyl 1-phosphate transferase [Patescibacteria group bacterium]|nr:undecaprenyl/decaprenyl-phosphate alpha-N-acetylglucosaminyl 1-phosphate transferase [Patescibacteria group bacterium]
MYLEYFLLAFILCFSITPIVRITMRSFKVVDEPKLEARKIHKKKISLGGGLAVFISFFVIIFFILIFTDKLRTDVGLNHLLGFFLGGLILMVGGFLDDKYRLKAKQQIIAPILATLIVIAFGVGPDIITNPVGGVINLQIFQLTLNNAVNWFWLADLVVFIWLMIMMFTTKLLDGLDGLVTGIVLIGAMMIGFLSLQDLWLQPDVALLSFIFAGACFGFLIWNWHPAKIFLGEGGSLFLGFMLGGLAIISGGKIATTLLVLGLPMIDMVRVVVERIKKGKPFYEGDSEHLHFRLLQSGFSQKQAVLLFYAIAFLFGISTLFLQSSQKLIALLFLFVLMMLAGVYFSKKNK